MIWFLGSVHEEAKRQGLVPQVPFDPINFCQIQAGQVDDDVLFISYVDDSLLVLFGHADIVRRIRAMIGILHRHASMINIKLNYKVGKTQPIVKFRVTHRP